MKKTGRLLVFAVVTAIVASACAAHTEPTEARMVADTAALALVLPTLESLGVLAYRNQDWCKNIYYSRGAFTSNAEASTCNLFSAPPKPFDAQADSDFVAISTAIAATGVAVIWIADDPHGYEFEFDAGGFQYWRYVFDPGYVLPEDFPNEVEYTAIDDSWYFVWEEWM